MIRCLIFDLGNTIIPFDFHRAYHLMEQRTGLSAETLREKIRQTGLVPRFESGRIETADFVGELTTAIGAPMTPEEFLPIWGAIFESETLVPDGLPATLRANGYRLLVLSNTNDLHMRFIRPRYPLLRHFHHLVLSHEVKAMKPDPEIYRAAIDNAGCAPEECFFVDDVPAYVQGAREMGIDAVSFSGVSQLMQDLEQRGVRT
jgi:putative hydrolase of the HAD superfamily